MNEAYGDQDRTIVIGGGLAGLIAAGRLAAAGRKVLLVERSPQLGGRARSIEKHGATFNLGAHAYYLGGAFERNLKQLGVTLEGGAPPSNRPLLIWGGQLVSLPRLIAARSFLSFAEKGELIRVVLHLGRLNVQEIGRMSLREFAERTTRYPSVRNLLYALMRTASYTLNPDEQLAKPVVSQLIRTFKDGLLYLNGGWQSIVDQLEQKYMQAGGQLLREEPVRQVEHEEGVVKGVRLASGGFLPARHVILTASPAENMKLVQGGEETVLRRWKEEARASMVASLDLCLKRLPAAGRNFALGIDQPVFFTNHSASARLTADGSQVVHVTKYHGTLPADPNSDEKLLEETMDLVHPGWRKEVVARRYLPRVTVVHDYSHTGRSSEAVGPDVPEVAGLYAAGDWVNHGEELLADAAAASAERAVQRILSEQIGGGAERSAAAAMLPIG